MRDVAWVGRRSAFEKQFRVRKGCYVDKKADVTYWCIDSPERAHGRRFDEVAIGYTARSDGKHYYSQLYTELRHTRMKEIRDES